MVHEMFIVLETVKDYSKTKLMLSVHNVKRFFSERIFFTVIPGCKLMRIKEFSRERREKARKKNEFFEIS